MTALRTRLERVGKDLRFKKWFEMMDLLERFTEDELDFYASTGELPETVRCATLSERPSRLDGLDRKALLRMWEEHERFFAGWTQEELDHYAKTRQMPERFS